MRRKIIIFSIIVMLGLFVSSSIANALTLSIENITAKKGEEFTVRINMDSKITVANGHIKYDGSKLEFVKANQNNMHSNVVADGDLAWIYVDMSGQGTENYEFVFKLKEGGETELKLEDLCMVDDKNNEYKMEDISGPTTFKVNQKNNTMLVIIIAVAVIVLIIPLLMKKKK